MKIRALNRLDWPLVSEIYKEGMATGFATFEVEVPTWDKWNEAHLDTGRFVAVIKEKVVGWAALSPISYRAVYRGVAELSVYVAKDHRGKGVGDALMRKLIAHSETVGIWTLQAKVFPKNKASLALHQKLGFRTVGLRERIAQLRGVWYDNYILERRSGRVGI